MEISKVMIAFVLEWNDDDDVDVVEQAVIMQPTYRWPSLMNSEGAKRRVREEIKRGGACLDGQGENFVELTPR